MKHFFHIWKRYWVIPGVCHYHYFPLNLEIFRKWISIWLYWLKYTCKCDVNDSIGSPLLDSKRFVSSCLHQRYRTSGKGAHAVLQGVGGEWSNHSLGRHCERPGFYEIVVLKDASWGLSRVDRCNNVCVNQFLDYKGPSQNSVQHYVRVIPKAAHAHNKK